MDRYPSNLPTEGQTFRRVEVLSGEPRRRRWTEAQKAAIVAESLVAGAVARHVALRHGLHPHQLYVWRRTLARDGDAGGAAAGCSFVPVALSQPEGGRTSVPAGGVEIEVGGVVVRVGPGVEMNLLRAVLGVVKGA